MTPAAIISELERRGVAFAVVGDKLRAWPASAIPADLDAAIGEHKAEVIVELRKREVLVEAARLLRQDQWPPAFGTCAFHIGNPGESCRRCSGPWLEHTTTFVGRPDREPS